MCVRERGRERGREREREGERGGENEREQEGERERATSTLSVSENKPQHTRENMKI